MLETIDLQNILVLDIETVSNHPNFSEMEPHVQALWERKVSNNLREGESASDVYATAGLHAEFGKAICVSVGVFHQRDGKTAFRLKSFTHRDERNLLIDFTDMLRKQPSNLIICGHNIKGFDIPYLCRRMLINRVPIPTQLDVTGKKPWELNQIDTMELWRFGDFRNYISLNLMAAVLDIPTPKDDINGEDVHRVYYEENNMNRIRVYCEKDVITTAQILQRLRNNPLIESDAISFAD